MRDRFLGSMVLCAGLLLASPAFAQDGASVSGNVALTTDYAFRGLSQTGGNPAVQGGFDYTNGMFYAGAWGSNIDFEELGAGSGIELDLYGGFRPQAGQVTFDIGVIGYLYPGVTDIQAGGGVEGELDYVEGYVKASIAPAEGATVGIAAFYSPEFTGETGEAYYLEANGSYAFSDRLSVSGAVGYQSIDDVSGVFAGDFSDEYATWNVGASYAVHGITLDLRYVGTDVEATDDLITQAFITEARADDRVILTVRRALWANGHACAILSHRRSLRYRSADRPYRVDRLDSASIRLVDGIKTRSILMGDFVFIGIGLGSFALLMLFVQACGRA